MLQYIVKRLLGVLPTLLIVALFVFLFVHLLPGDPTTFMLGMDAARQGYYRAFGGSPGLSYLLREFSALMDHHGLGAATRDRLFVQNPARAFAFSEVDR